MKNNILVSVIIPNFNHEMFLKLRIESVLNQTYQNIEVILLDDGSTDSSVALLNEYINDPKVTATCFNKINSGSTFIQWQRGLDLAKGDYIWIAESDDYAEPDFLSSLLEVVTKSPQTLDVIYSQSYDIDEHCNKLGSRLDYTSDIQPNIWTENFTMDGNTFIRQYLKIKNVIPNASAVIFNATKAKTIDFSRHYNNMHICGDLLFWIEMIQGGKIGFIARKLNYFRTHTSVTRIHNSYEKLLKRCIEERTVRHILAQNFDCEQKQELEVLYNRWFTVHNIKSLLKKEFYSVKLPQTSIVKYISLFIQKLRAHNKAK